MSDIPVSLMEIILVFGIIFAVFVGGGTYMLKYNKKNPMNDSKTLTFTFFEFTLQFARNDTNKIKAKNLSKCMYRPYSNYQFVKTVTNKPEFITFKIHTGSVNGIPQYAKYDIPKSCIGSELNEFEDFLKERLGKHYKVKEPK
jgi:hypothetical protein